MSAFDRRPGLRRLFRHDSTNAADARGEMDEEIESLIAERVDALVLGGMSEADARAAAMRRLSSNIDGARQQLHDVAVKRNRTLRMRRYADDLLQDLRYAIRGLNRRRGFTLAAVLTLALGIGSSSAIFSAVDALLLRPLPFVRPDELMKLIIVAPDVGALTGNAEMRWSYPKYAMFRDAQREFSALSLYQGWQFNTTYPEVHFLPGERVGATYLRTLGIVPVLGRDLDLSLDQQPGAAREVVISYALWQEQFAGESHVVGRTIELNGSIYTIVGVTEQGFKGLTGAAQVFVPVTAQRVSEHAGAQSHVYNLVARRKRNVSEKQAAAATATLGERVNHAFPNPASTSTWRASALPLDGVRVAPFVRTSILILFGAVLLVNLIACTNVANLLLGRANQRGKEIALRLAIGASRARLIRLLLTESMLLACLGSAAGVAVAWAGTRTLSTVNPAATFGVRQNDGLGAVSFSAIALDSRVVFFALLLSLTAGIIFGLFPALTVTQRSLGDSLRASAGSTTRDRAGFISKRRALVMLEVSLAMVLLVGSGLMTRSLAKLLASDYGFNGDHVMTARVTLYSGGGSLEDSMSGYWDVVTTRLVALPGVLRVGLGDCAPLNGGCSSSQLSYKDGAKVDAGQSPLLNVNEVNAEWFNALGVPLKRGRLFSRSDDSHAPRVVVINEVAARLLFPNGDALGHRIRTHGGMDSVAQIVGVVGNVRQSPDSAAPPTIFASPLQSPRQRLRVFVKTSIDVASVSAGVQRAIHEVLPYSAVDDVRTMSEFTASATARARFSATLLGLFAIAALTLAVIGIYGVMALTVAARTREIGIRIALGADGAHVQRVIIVEGVALVAIGMTVGLVAAVASTRVLRSLLFELTPTDPATYAGIVVVLAVTAVGASWIPARRAARIDPVRALRTE